MPEWADNYKETIAFRKYVLVDIPRWYAYNILCSVNQLERYFDMDYMTIKEAAEKWGLSVRRVQEICTLEKVPGVVKFGHEWAIPKDAEKPTDLRVKSGKYIKS